MAIYIRSSSCISPQHTFGATNGLVNIVEYIETRLRAIEPDYALLIDHKALRRMSHVIRMGVAAAQLCLQHSGTSIPGAIITGTAYGCLEATLTFATSVVNSNEEDVSPTAFMQSTHNTVAAQIALTLTCHQYNNTFGHKAISFESALLDSIMLLNEEEATTVLVGGLDEMTDISFIILNRLGSYKRQRLSNVSLLKSNTKGTIGGEGAAFFLLSKQESPDNLAQLNGLHVFYKPNDQAEIEKQILKFLHAHGTDVDDIDLLIAGKNGDLKNDAVYQQFSTTIFKTTPVANYKHLCGEYPTSTSFALWLASSILKTSTMPAGILEESAMNRTPKKILIYNHFLNRYHCLILLSQC